MCHAWGKVIKTPWASMQVDILTNTAMFKMINIPCSVSIIWRLNGVARSTIHIKQNISGLAAGTCIESQWICTKLRAATIVWVAFINIYNKETRTLWVISFIVLKELPYPCIQHLLQVSILGAENKVKIKNLSRHDD